jgi:2-haloacid dehalogenase
MISSLPTYQSQDHPKYEYLLFDLDNTLLDYNLAEETALTATFNDFHIHKDFEKLKTVYNQINSGYWRAFEEKRILLSELKIARFRDMISAFPALSHLDAGHFSETYLDHLSEQVHLVPGALELLEKLYGNYRMCLITNGIARVQHRRIAKSGFDKYFEKIIISEEIGISKPNPDFFHYALNLLGNPEAEKVLIIGDNISSDIGGGINLGLAGCWFNPEKSENTSKITPTFIISQLSDLINILTL